MGLRVSTHALSCAQYGDRIVRHNLLRDILLKQQPAPPFLKSASVNHCQSWHRKIINLNLPGAVKSRLLLIGIFHTNVRINCKAVNVH